MPNKQDETIASTVESYTETICPQTLSHEQVQQMLAQNKHLQHNMGELIEKAGMGNVSNLRKDIQKRKDRKLRKRITRTEEHNKRVLAMDKNAVVEDVPEAPLDDLSDIMGTAVWSEVTSIRDDIRGLLDNYRNILLAGIALQKQSNVVPDDHLVTCDRLGKDLSEFTDMWTALTIRINEREGTVSVDDIADFHVLFDELMALQSNINTALVDDAMLITEAVQTHSTPPAIEGTK